MAQTTITNYFLKRKRTGDDFNKHQNKILRIDQGESIVDISQNINTAAELLGINTEGSKESTHNDITIIESSTSQALVYESSVSVFGNENKSNSLEKDLKPHEKAKKIQQPSGSRDIGEILLKIKQTEMSNSHKQCDSTSGDNVTSSEQSKEMKCNVSFELKGCLSPSKKCKENVRSENEEEYGHNITTNIEVHTDRRNIIDNNSTSGIMVEDTTKEGFKTPKKVSSREELSLEQLKKKLHRSAKMMEMRKCFANLNNAEDELKKLEKKRKELDKPKLKTFQAIEIEVPTSPQKSIYSSPQKGVTSPQTTPTKLPAYQRHAFLAAPSALPLPFHYNHLAEIFRCVDTVSSMLHNRKEMITFKKLKPAVQKMLTRNFVERHLGQIKKVYPTAYDFKQEKCRNFGSTSKTEQYDLILSPVAHTRILNEDSRQSNSESNTTAMTPSCLFERRQDFLNNLLEITKDYHEEYLRSLDPPMVIPRDKLTRWHPGFGLDQVPDIVSESLPQPPNVEKYSTAKDVLEKAKNLFNCNQRMERALNLVSEQSSKIEPPETTKKNISPVPDLLKGIPKALLEKVRAKQAAKALEAMTRTPAQNKEATQHVRLPEMARILRNLFVAEKKSVLQLDFVLEKLSHSYRERLSRAELEEHIRLIIKVQPEWLKILQTRKIYFLRLSKEKDMSLVMKHLEGLAVEKNKV